MPPASLRPLRHRNYALVFAGGFVSNAGTWMQTIAVGAYMVQVTGRAAWVALSLVVGFLPIGLIAPFAGYLADRVDKRRFLMVANVLNACTAASLALLMVSGHASPGRVTAVVFIDGCIGALRLPFYQAMVPELVPREDLLGAVSLGTVQWNLGRVLGPALGGAVVALWDYSAAFTVNAVSYFAVVIALSFVRLQGGHPHRAEERLWEGIRAGARTALGEPGCRAAIGLIALAALLAAPFMALIPAVARDLAGESKDAVAAATGALTTAQGVGAVVGALTMASLAERFGRRQVVVFRLVATPVAVALYAFSPSLAIAVPMLAVVAFMYIGILSGLNVTVQLRAPDAYRGRVLSLYMVALHVVYPIGALLEGAIADQAGLSRTLAGGGIVMLLVLGWLWIFRPRVFSALGDAEEVEEAHPDWREAMTRAGRMPLTTEEAARTVDGSRVAR